jgi:hypothetical protein
MPVRQRCKVNKMIETQNPTRKFAYFVLGIAVPLAAYVIWSRTIGAKCAMRKRVDEAHDITVEDSFPASDPPSAW